MDRIKEVREETYWECPCGRTSDNDKNNNMCPCLSGSCKAEALGVKITTILLNKKEDE